MAPRRNRYVCCLLFLLSYQSIHLVVEHVLVDVVPVLCGPLCVLVAPVPDVGVRDHVGQVVKRLRGKVGEGRGDRLSKIIPCYFVN